jgi:hypothetical protein
MINTRAMPALSLARRVALHHRRSNPTLNDFAGALTCWGCSAPGSSELRQTHRRRSPRVSNSVIDGAGRRGRCDFPPRRLPLP